METIIQYLNNLLEDQKIPDNYLKEMQNDREAILNIINGIEGIKNPTPYYGGSYGKKTMIRESYDLDILLYYDSDELSIKELYFTVRNAIKSHYPNSFQKNVAIRIDKRDGYHIDVVPAKRYSTDEDFANLYKSKSDSPLKTSVKKHIEIISNFARRDILKLMKLWKIRNGIDIPSFLLELISIKIIEDTKISLDEALKKVFRFLSSQITSCKIEDPATPSNNIAADDVTDSFQKELCNKIATWSLSQNIDSVEGWKEVFRKKSHDFTFQAKNKNQQIKSRLSPDSPGTRFA